MKLYYQTTFGCKQTSTLEDTVKIVNFFYYISPLCDLDTEHSEPIFQYDTSPHDNPPQ